MVSSGHEQFLRSLRIKIVGDSFLLFLNWCQREGMPIKSIYDGNSPEWISWFENWSDFFFFNFDRHRSFWGHWYFCFGLLVLSTLGFKVRVDPFLAVFFTHMKWIPQIHLWVQHLLIFWQPALQLALLTHILAHLSKTLVGLEPMIEHAAKLFATVWTTNVRLDKLQNKFWKKECPEKLDGQASMVEADHFLRTELKSCFENWSGVFEQIQNPFYSIKMCDIYYPPPGQGTYPPSRSGRGRGYTKVPTPTQGTYSSCQGTYPLSRSGWGGYLPPPGQGTYPPSRSWWGGGTPR